MSSIDAFTDEPNVVNRATTAVPTISAEALEAMRRGLRIALRRARRPVKPRASPAPAPSTAADGRATTGPRTTNPTSMARAPSPARAIAPSSSDDADTTVAAPAAAITKPAIARVRDAAERSMATSRSAASGATRDALSAGETLATSVVSTPTRPATMIVPVVTTRPAVGSASPAPAINAFNPAARPRPTPNPMAEATTPMISASRATAVTTCRREAPIARSSADSRVRWATRIENVLWMLNVATTRAIPANARRTISNMFRKSSPICCSCSAVSSAWVSASMWAGSNWVISSRSASWLTPSSAPTSTAEIVSGAGRRAPSPGAA